MHPFPVISSPPGNRWPWWLGVAAVVLALLAGTLLRPAPEPLTTLRVGLEAGALPVPNGDRDYTGERFEPLFAGELAERLGAAVVLVPLAPAALVPALQQRTVDLVLMRQAAREPPVADVRAWPTGFQSGLSVAMRSDTDVRRWSELSGRVLCSVAGNPRARELVAALRGELHAQSAPAQVLAQVRTGACAAAILDRAQLDPLFLRPEWLKFSATLPPLQASLLVAAVSTARPGLAAALRGALAELGTPERWAQRRAQWAANVAFEVYFDQIGPDCH